MLAVERMAELHLHPSSTRLLQHPAHSGGGSSSSSSSSRAWTLFRPATACVLVRATSSSSSSSSGQQQPAYPYNSGDSRQQKATIEHIFTPDAADHFTSGAAGPAGPSAAAADDGDGGAPWAVGWQMNERNLVWNAQLKLRLMKRVASQQLGLTDEELESRLQSITCLLPDLADRLAGAPPSLLAQLAVNTHEVAARLLRLKVIFPQANTSALVCSRLSLLLEEDLQQVEAAAARLRQLLGPAGVSVDAFVAAHPQVLFVDDFEAALQDAQRLMPKLDVTAALRSDPQLVLSFQRGAHLIPYDPPWPVTQP